MKIDFVAKFGKYILAVVIAIVGFLSGSITDVGQAVQVALAPDKAIVQATEILNETPASEVQKAVAEDKAE